MQVASLRRRGTSPAVQVPESGRLRQRVLRGVAGHATGVLIFTAGHVLLVPVYLAHWSPTVYGEWLALFSLAQYLWSLDMGMNTAVANRLTQAFSRGDLEEYRRTQHTAFVFYLVLAIGGGLLLAFVSWLLPLHAWLGLREITRTEGAWTVCLLGVFVLGALPLSTVSMVYRSTGHLFRDYRASNGFRVATLVMAALVLVLGGRAPQVALGQLFALLLVAVYVIWDVRRRFPGFLPGMRSASRRVLRQLLRPSLLFGLIMIATAIVQQGSVLVISSALGGLAVALFVTSRTLTNLIRQVVTSLFSALWPELTRMETLGHWGTLRSVHRLLMVGCTVIAAGFSAALWFEGDEIIRIWTGGKVEPDLTLLRLLLVMIVLQLPWQVSVLFTASANRHATVAWAQMLAGVVGIGLAIPLLPRLGIHAIPVGLIVGEALACYHFVVRDTCRMLGEPYGAFAKWLWSGLACVAAGALLGAWLAHGHIPGPAPLAWAGMAAAGLTCAAALAWSLWLTADDRSSLISHLPPRLRPQNVLK